MEYWQSVGKVSILSIRNLVVRFGRFTAVDRISLEVGRGEIFGFLGPNGAGKTTTLTVLTGRLLPSGGSISIDGHDLVSGFRKIKPLFGYVPDFDNHFGELTAEVNLRIFCGLYHVNPVRIASVLDAVELGAERSVRVEHFSKGMKKKLIIAREMLHEPALLYLDEPTANLDLHSVQNIRERLRELRARGSTIFLTTHNMEEAEELCDRIAIIDQGQIIEIDSPTNFKTRHGLSSISVVYREEGREHRVELEPSNIEDRARLSEIVGAGKLLSIHSNEFNFRQVFLKLTGKEYQ